MYKSIYLFIKRNKKNVKQKYNSVEGNLFEILIVIRKNEIRRKQNKTKYLNE